MTDFAIKVKNNEYFVPSNDRLFHSDFGDGLEGYRSLLVIYESGEAEPVTAKTPEKLLLLALYDLYEADDTYGDGDTFSLGGAVIARAIGPRIVLESKTKEMENEPLSDEV